MAQRLSDKEQWELLINEMGYMAKLRNLRNFDKAAISKNIANRVMQQISDPKEVAKSKQLPFRFYTAWLNVSDKRWANALESALDASIPNIPQMDGRSLILIDTSASMRTPMSDPTPRGSRGRMINARTGQEEEITSKRPDCVDAGALFGLALALRNPGNADVFGFADGQMAVQGLGPGTSLLKATEAFGRTIGNVGHGTQIERAIRDTYNSQDRVFIFTDMQTIAHENVWPYGNSGDVTRAVPADKHVYGFDLSGYTNTAMDDNPYRHEMGGLTDHTFGAIAQIEAGAGGKWPWE